MQSIPKEVEWYIYRLLHESRMKQLLREYHSSYKWGTQYLASRRNNMRTANYRNTTGYEKIHLLLEPRWMQGIHTDFLPKKYFYSSGLNSPLGYKNE